MAYDNDFYAAYSAYLREPTVRRAHDRVFQMIRGHRAFRNVIDLGCGLSEFYEYAEPRSYTGIDLNAEPVTRTSFRLAQADYRNLEIIGKLTLGRRPGAFISLFSSEITAPVQNNTRFYEELFGTVPSFTAALVSGFYYQRRKDVNPVEETGGILSYQTLGDIDDYESPVYDQSWVTMRVPSKLFGDDVVEIWRLLERRS